MGAPSDPPPAGPVPRGAASRLRRDLGTLASYAALVGILVGAGIFKVTGEASARTGSGVVLGYLVLAPAVFAASVGYATFLSTSLGGEPGGDYGHVAAVLGRGRLAFLVGWMKIISYVGAAAYLAGALADHLLELDAATLGCLGGEGARVPLAAGSLVLFGAVNAVGVRWYGRVQVAMCVVLGVAIAVLVLPGLFAVELATYRPLLPHGLAGFLSALPPLFFAYAGFESLAHAGGEVQDGRRRLPRVFLRGILASTAIFLGMSFVAFGVLPAPELAASPAPMVAAAATYLPFGAAALVTVGGVFAVATSLNATLFVPARLALILAEEGFLPRPLAAVHAARGTPVPALTLTTGAALLLVLSGQVGMTLNVAVCALVSVYLLHAVAVLLLPRRRPDVWSEVEGVLSPHTRLLCAALSAVTMALLLGTILVGDARALAASTLAERFSAQGLTSTELLLLWAPLGLLVRRLARRQSP